VRLERLQFIINAGVEVELPQEAADEHGLRPLGLGGGT
jgi:hypothetical protein